jgi:hypothetical protein
MELQVTIEKMRKILYCENKTPEVRNLRELLAES